VGFIEDEDLVTVSDRSKDGSLAEVSGIVNTIVTCSVNLNYVERTAAVAREVYTAWANSTWGIGWALGTVEATSQNSGRSCLSATTWP
jgi:hypothetical protein